MSVQNRLFDDDGQKDENDPVPGTQQQRPEHSGRSSDGAWLKQYLEESNRRSLCTKIRCTTCGASEFRRGLLRAYAAATSHAQTETLDYETALGIANALTVIEQPTNGNEKMTKAVRCILHDLWSAFWPNAATLRSVLVGCWADAVLQSMEEHERNVQAVRRARAEFEDPVRVNQRREEKMRLKQERHQRRLALKVQKDRMWRQTHPDGK